MSKRVGIGQAELAILRYIGDRHPVTVREVAEQFADRRGYARTTVQTVMERLRRKGYLARRKEDGVYRYSPRQPQTDLLQRLVREFVETTLGGSLSPFVTYLVEEASLSEEELKQLRRLVEELGEDREEPRG